MLKGKEILSVREQRYNQSLEKLSPFQNEARTDMEYYLGKQYSAKELAYLEENEREVVTNNKIRRAVNLLTGEQRQNRLGSVVLPINDNIPEEIETADQMSSIVQFVLQKHGGYFHISNCFQGAMIAGINFSEIYFDYSDDYDNGEFKFLRIPYNAVLWDPYFQEFDLSDCNHIMRRKYISKATAIGLLPEKRKEINKLVPNKRDGMFPTIPFENNANGQPLLAYDEFWERDTRLVMYMVNMESNARIQFPDDTKKKEAQNLIKDMNQQAQREVVKLVEKYKATVNLYCIIEGEVFYSGRDPNKIDDYPFVPFMAYHTPEYSEYDLNLQSFIRAARDPQRELNKRISKALDMMDSRLYGGEYYKPGKLIDQDDMYRTGNHGNIALKDDAVIGQDIAPRVLPDVPQSIFQMQTIFDENIMSVLNLTDASFGVQQKGDQSGFLTMLQQSSAMVGLQPLYDNLNFSQSALASKVVKMSQNWSDDKIERITGKPVSPMFRDKDFSKWDMQCAQSVLTEHQKKLKFTQMVELKAMGIDDITGTMLAKAAPIQDRSTFLAELEANEQSRMQQQQQAQEIQNQKEMLNAEYVQSQIRENEADITRKNSRAVADVALSQAHTSEADQKRASAVLDMAKAATEISANEDSRFYSAVDFISSLQDRYRDQNQLELLLDKGIVDQMADKSLSKPVGV